MSFEARVFRVLIASPSDVADERDIAVSIVQTWNDQNAAERQVVILPLRWETHSTPEYGKRPQEIINRQIVDQCDLLVGIFWTRIGTPSGEADSGTLEEIERVAAQGKPVMLYFSKVRQEPDAIDTGQLEKLREFKKKTFSTALVEHFTSQIDFRDKLSKQIDTQLRALITEQNQPDDTSKTDRPGTLIELGFCDPDTGNPVGSTLESKTTIVSLSGVDRLPDFGGEKSQNGLLSISRENPHFYRQLAEFFARRAQYVPLRLWLRNSGGLGARDLYVDIRIRSVDAPIVLEPMTRLSPPIKSGLRFHGNVSTNDRPAIEKSGEDWTITVELPALQPKRTIILEPLGVLAAARTAVVHLDVRIFADTLSEPITQSLKLQLDVTEATKTARRILEDEGVRLPTSARKGNPENKAGR